MGSAARRNGKNGAAFDRREVARLVAAARSARDRLLVQVLCCGIRATECLRLLASSVYADRRGCWIKVGGRRGREVPIPDSLYELVKAYLKVEDIQPRERLFAGSRAPGRPPHSRPALTRSGVSQALTALSGTSHVSPRACFDLWLAAMAAADVDPRLAARVCGLHALTGTIARAYGESHQPLTREEHDAVVHALPF